MRASLLVAGVLVSLSGCPKNDDFTPQIHVTPGAAARAQWILSHRAPGSDAGKSVAAHPSRVHSMVAGDELGGPNAVGKPGDLLMENDEVAFVIDRLGSSAGFAASGGNLVDAADARSRKDELGQQFTYFGTFPRQGVYEKVASGVTPEGAAWVSAEGRELYDASLRVATRYTLAPSDRALLIETEVTNGGDHVSEKISLGDAIQWGGTEKMAPGQALNFKGPSSGPFVGGVGRATSYAITSTEGAIEAYSGGSWTDTVQRKEVVLKPGEKVHYARVFLVGERGDSASLVSELAKSAGQEVGALKLSLVDGEGKEIETPAGGKAILSRGGAEVLSIVAMQSGRSFEGEVPPGTYDVEYGGGGGRRSKGTKTRVTISAGKTSQSALAVSGAGSLWAKCVDDAGALPCKVTLEGLGATPTPDFGPAHYAGPSKSQITTSTGDIDVAVAPGRYRVTLSRGPEYTLAQYEEDVPEGKRAGRPSRLQRVLDASGYVATDFHQHTMLGADSAVSTHDRVIGNAAEGVEVAVASEHNVVADLEPLVRELHLEKYLVEIPGNELTSDASRKPWGHANVFPLTVDPTRPRGGATLLRDRTPHDVFAELRAIPTPHVLQVNHPRTGITGYFDQYHFDAATGVGTDPGYDPDFDALEVWNGRNVAAREAVLKDFLAILRAKHPMTATADTDTHGIVGQEAGYPRTYVRVEQKEKLEAWDEKRNADLVRGVRERRDVVLTNGPFLRVSANGVGIGGVVSASRELLVRVHVEAAPWVKVDRVRIVRVVDVLADAIKPAGDLRVTLAPTPKGARASDVVFRLRVRAGVDDAFVVIAEGDTPMTPVLAGDAKEISPFAVTGAIWIDADGDGLSLGRSAK